MTNVEKEHVKQLSNSQKKKHPQNHHTWMLQTIINHKPSQTLGLPNDDDSPVDVGIPFADKDLKLPENCIMCTRIFESAGNILGHILSYIAGMHLGQPAAPQAGSLFALGSFNQ